MVNSAAALSATAVSYSFEVALPAFFFALMTSSSTHWTSVRRDVTYTAEVPQPRIARPGSMM